ncbi:D-alanine aminotransferase [bacterium BMS3Bbin10]|nr:D-alanine aminotransferase [bacterium BMS3Bbin10]
MSRIVYLNGEYVAEEDAKISIFDRAFLFADGIYEVTAVINGKMVDFEPHMARLHRSLGELGMAQPVSDADLKAMHLELISRNSLNEGLIYMQITRGVAERDFGYPENARQTVVGFTQAKELIDPPLAKTGISIITVPDIRWQRRDIKTTGMLAQAMAKEAAKRAGANDAWMVEDGFVTEGTSNTAFIVLDDDILVTRPLSNQILPGITRRAIMTLAEKGDITVEERPFTVDEAKAACEAFLTSASSFVTPVVEIDGARIGGGQPGPVTRKLREIYVSAARNG